MQCFLNLNAVNQYFTTIKATTNYQAQNVFLRLEIDFNKSKENISIYQLLPGKITNSPGIVLNELPY